MHETAPHHGLPGASNQMKHWNGKPVLCYKQVCASKKDHFKTLPQFAMSWARDYNLQIRGKEIHYGTVPQYTQDVHTESYKWC